MERNQFTFYASFFRSISRIKNKTTRCAAYDAVCRYAITGEEEEDLPDAAAIAFEIIKPTLDASRRKAESGSAGGRAKSEANLKQAEANGKQTEANLKQGENESKYKDKNKNKNKNKDKCLKDAGAFDSFWSAYPRKEGKAKAMVAFEKVDVPLETLLAALEAQKKSPQWTKDAGQFVPHAATWLNGRRWEDECGSKEEPNRELDEQELAAIRRMMGS